MRRAVAVLLLAGLSVSACGGSDEVLVTGGAPDAPVALAASYYAGVVTVSWELGSNWNGEAFRVYARRSTDESYVLIAEVTSCSGGFCYYEDSNVVPEQTYLYEVAAVDPDTGIESPTDVEVEVFVPTPTPPPVPNDPFVIALDDANYLRWGTDSRDGASDFSFYRVYQDADGTSYLLGETDSEGFLDQRAANGSTYSYFVTAIDTDGHESAGSVSASGTPRPDYQYEWIYAYSDSLEASGFRFEEDQFTIPILSGDAPERHFRLESDGNQWFLVPGAGTTVWPTPIGTTALKCDVGADFDCMDVSVAPSPASSYVSQSMELFPEASYVLRVEGNDGLFHYGVVRVEFLGFSQGDIIMIFGWAYQLQAENPNLTGPSGG